MKISIIGLIAASTSLLISTAVLAADLGSPACKAAFSVQRGEGNALGLEPTGITKRGKFYVRGEKNGEIIEINAKTGETMRTLRAFRDPINNFQLTADQRSIIVNPVVRGGALVELDLASGASRALPGYPGELSPVQSFSLSENRSWLLTQTYEGRADTKIRLWDLHAQKLVFQVEWGGMDLPKLPEIRFVDNASSRFQIQGQDKHGKIYEQMIDPNTGAVTGSAPPLTPSH